MPTSLTAALLAAVPCSPRRVRRFIVGLTIEVLVLAEQHRVVARIAVRSRPAASCAFEGSTMRRPGVCAKIETPDWL